MKMAYLDREEGWVPLRRYEGDWDLLESMTDAALKELHACLDAQAVHGDLNPDNFFIRYLVCELQREWCVVGWMF